MKYIRTFDGKIFDTSKETIIFDTLYPKGEELLSNTINIKEDVLKQADTIEELCDEFVVSYEDGARIVYQDLEWAKVKAKASLEVGHKSIIYGAIWTDKGLIYVAKMNDKGELELL